MLAVAGCRAPFTQWLSLPGAFQCLCCAQVPAQVKDIKGNQ